MNTACHTSYRQAWTGNDERTVALAGFLHHYNYRRPRIALKGKPAAKTTTVATNLSGFNT